ncbi:MAG TPA: hypothetical protein VJN71_09725 [Nitrososphaerales archaeon]|nr:hypothetical protein [Nitrososphaerales archaeon]
MPRESFDYVISSEVRLTVLTTLSKSSSTPAQIARKVEKHLSHISRALRELEDRQLVSCLNPQDSKPRVYSLTSQGNDVCKQIERHQIYMHFR